MAGIGTGIKLKGDRRMAKEKNLGKQLEDKIIKENKLLKSHGMARVDKIPNNWVVRRKGPHIVGANPVPSGLCDFIGISNKLEKGSMFVFDAKECKLKTRFPLKNIKYQQMEHMADIREQGGIAFFIIWFTELDKTFFVPYRKVLPFWNMAEQSEDERQSIPLSFFEDNCYTIDHMDYFPHVIQESKKI